MSSAPTVPTSSGVPARRSRGRFDHAAVPSPRGPVSSSFASGVDDVRADRFDQPTFRELLSLRHYLYVADTESGLNETSLRQRLKRETAAVHQHLEAQLELLDPGLDMPRYLRVLGTFLWLLRPRRDRRNAARGRGMAARGSVARSRWAHRARSPGARPVSGGSLGAPAM